MLANAPICSNISVTPKSVLVALLWTFVDVHEWQKIESPDGPVLAEVKQDDTLPFCFCSQIVFFPWCI